jgi:CBS domain-containing protein
MVLARAQHALEVLADREMVESATGGDADSVWDLQDAACAVEYAISVLAPFAVAEQSEADCGDEMAAVGKALAAFDPAPLDTIEALSLLAKAGRVLSAGNEAAIRGAVEELQKVLASLPAAPTTSDDGGQAVAKEATVPETEAPVTPAEPVAKADKAPQVAVYDKNGKLVGIVDPDDIVIIADADAEPEAAAEEPAAAEPDAAPAPQTTDLDPAPAAEVGTPADAVPDDEAVAKSTTDLPEEVLKGIAETAAAAAFAQFMAAQEQDVAKQADDRAQLAELVETLKARVNALEEQPAQPKVFTNGALPPEQHMRGQGNGAAAVDVAAAQRLKKSLYSAADATEQNRIARDMQADAIAALSNIHNRA